MKRKKLIRRLLWIASVLFILMNTVAFFHAYKFTHFDASPAKTKSAAQLSVADKLRLALLGVSNPRPKAKALPDTIYTTIRLQSNKEIECWQIVVQNPKGTVVLFHGYGGEKSSLLDKGAIFRQLGYSTILVDFMGSGGSEGNQTTIGFKEAAQVKTCVQYLKESGAENIILFGTSLGAAAIMKAMADEPLPVSTLILECPFSTMLQTVKNRFATMGIPAVPMANLLVFWGGVQNGFNAYSHNPVAYARNIQCPVLLFYGAKDEKVTAGETKRIFNNLAGLKKLVTFPLAGRENYLTKYKREWTIEVALFLDGNVPVPAFYLKK